MEMMACREIGLKELWERAKFWSSLWALSSIMLDWRIAVVCLYDIQKAHELAVQDTPYGSLKLQICKHITMNKRKHLIHCQAQSKSSDVRS